MTRAKMDSRSPRRAPRQVRKSAEEPAVRPRARTLRAGVLAVFAWADRARLESWEARVREEARKAPEPLLFVALLCGAQFRVFHLEVAPVLRDFGSWLTSHPRRMDSALADIIVDAMTPA